MKQELENLIATVLTQLDLSDIHADITVTDDPTHGDYATNVAFQAAKKLGKTPMQAAEIISYKLRPYEVDSAPVVQTTNYELIKKIEVAKPGFINFTLTNKVLMSTISPLVYSSSETRSSRFARTVSAGFNGKKIMVEFTDPNPFKELHIGHLYSNIVGESISRLLEANGAEVRRVCYQGDVGLHVAKAMYGLIANLKSKNSNLEEMDKKSLAERAKFLGESYALGATEYEESETAKQEIIAINKQVYQKDPEVMEMYTKGRQWSLDYFESVYQRLGTNFTKLYFESDAGPIGLQLVKDYPEVFTESQGAIVFAGEEYGLHTRVFVNSLGLPTYEAKELGLAVTKYGDYPYDQSIMITGNEINEYFKVLLKAISLIRPDIATKMKHISHGIVRLPEGKMSSRTGKIVRAEWLLDEAVAKAKEKIQESKEYPKGTSFSEATQKVDNQEGVTPRESDHMRGVSPEDADNIAELVGVGAVKWALLKSGIGKDIEFSFDESVSFEGNSGPYLQYTFVRTQSVLHKADLTPVPPGRDSPSPGRRGLSSVPSPFEGEGQGEGLSKEERALLVLLCQYSDIVQSAAEKYAPSTLATYLFELAQLFNNFYQKYPILKATSNIVGHPRDNEDPDSRVRGNDKDASDIRTFRLALTAKVGETIKGGLYLLGIESPERM